MECTSCGGHGCDFCNGRGTITIEGCPYDEVRDILGTIDMIELFERGQAPILAGVLDQSAWFINVVQHWKRENAKVKADA